MTIELRDLRPDDAETCDAIILSLPYFFGDADGRRDCAEAVRTQEGIIAERDGAPVAFITLESHAAGSAEITWLAVQAEHRRAGIGRMLVEAAAQRLEQRGASVMFVLTLGPSVPEPEDVTDNYSGTRAFYERLGFVPLRELELRTWNNAFALMLARPLRP